MNFYAHEHKVVHSIILVNHYILHQGCPGHKNHTNSIHWIW